jgi:hypothetical protein
MGMIGRFRELVALLSSLLWASAAAPRNQSRLWKTRESAVKALRRDLAFEAGCLAEAFDVLDELIDIYQAHIGSSDYITVCGAATVKGRNLALGSYSLCLDGLAQEGGALLRPLVECVEKLEYLREDPRRAADATLAKMPTAGTIAEQIGSPYRCLRTYLNDHAAHFRFGYESVRHLIDWSAPTWVKQQPFMLGVLKVNLRAVLVFMSQLATQSAECLSTAKIEIGPLSERIERLRDVALDSANRSNDPSADGEKRASPCSPPK